MKNLDVKLQLEELIKIYEEEAKDRSDEFSHGDGLAKSETYKKIIKDLNYILNGKLEKDGVYTILLEDQTLITGRFIEEYSYKICVDCSDKYRSSVVNLDKDRIKSFIKLS